MKNHRKKIRGHHFEGISQFLCVRERKGERVAVRMFIILFTILTPENLHSTPLNLDHRNVISRSKSETTEDEFLAKPKVGFEPRGIMGLFI